MEKNIGENIKNNQENPNAYKHLMIKEVEINNEIFIIKMQVIDNSLLFLVYNNDSLEEYERKMSFKELNEFKAFSLLDNVAEVFEIILETLQNKENYSFEFDEKKNLELKIDISVFSKKLSVIINLTKNSKSNEDLLEHLRREVKLIKLDNKLIKEENIELKNIVTDLKDQLNQVKNDIAVIKKKDITTLPQFGFSFASDNLEGYKILDYKTFSTNLDSFVEFFNANNGKIPLLKEFETTNMAFNLKDCVLHGKSNKNWLHVLQPTGKDVDNNKLLQFKYLCIGTNNNIIKTITREDIYNGENREQNRKELCLFIKIS